jgi:hypothetical protein
LQDLPDRSYTSSGPHLLSFITPERRLSAGQVVDRLPVMRLLALATVTADGRIVGPVDGILLRGAFHFGSSPDSVRFATSEIDRRSAPPICLGRSAWSPSTIAPFPSTSPLYCLDQMTRASSVKAAGAD